MQVNDISLNGLNFTRSQEGRALRAYQDTTGVWTIGYGVTNYDKGIGFKVGPGVTITPDTAEWLLLWTLRRNYLPDVFRVIDQSKVAHPQGAVDGGADFHYNTGGITRASWPKDLNEGNLTAARASLESWNKAGGRVLSDLVRRRSGEWLEIEEENYGHLGGPTVVVPNSAGRETYHGSAGLLTAYPTDPADPVSTVAATGAPVPSSSAVAPPAASVLVPGVSGPAVTDVQDKLTSVGIPTPPTGVYDATTEASVTKFQQTHPQLTADGTVGPATTAALTRAQDMRAKISKAAKASTALPVASAGLWQYVSDNAAEIALIAGVAFAVAAIGLVAWEYRNEISAALNKARGKIVP